jgi:hypothetical protein
MTSQHTAGSGSQRQRLWLGDYKHGEHRMGTAPLHPFLLPDKFNRPDHAILLAVYFLS